MKNYDQIQAQLADLSDMIAQVHQQDLQAHRDKVKQQAVAEQSYKERILTQAVARATGIVEAVIKDYIRNKNYMEACAQLDNLIWLHKELPLDTVSEKWVTEYKKQREEVMSTAVYSPVK
jgi:hypothetical protein